MNEEIGSSLVIPEDAKYSVYDAYKNYTPEEFEVHIKQEYLDALSSGVGSEIVVSGVSGNNPLAQLSRFPIN